VSDPLAVVETDRLVLERWSVAAHTADLVRINREPEAMRFIGDGATTTPEASADMSARVAAHWERFGFGLWAVRPRGAARIVGFTGLSHPLWFPAERERVEVGWRLHPDAWGNGYATEAGEAALRAAAEPLALDRVVSFIDPANERSVAVARRLGLRHERDTTHPTQGTPLAVYATTV
jgi:RimJ/RimL family protein N-acetyltransferase